MENLNATQPVLTPGAYYRLTRDINAIPSGVYRFDGDDGPVLWFMAGKRVPFFITCEVIPWLEFVPPSRACLVKTSAKEFTDRYYALLETLKHTRRSSKKPFTGCFMPAELAHEMN